MLNSLNFNLIYFLKKALNLNLCFLQNIFRIFCFLAFAFITVKISFATVELDGDLYNNAKINCFIRHLKKEKLLRENFEEFSTQSKFNQSNCENFVQNVENFYYNRIKNGTSFNVQVPDVRELLESQGDCIEIELRKENYGDLFLKSLVYDALKPLSEDLEIERNETTFELKRALSSAISSCTFSKLYDAYINIRRRNYCARKYVVEHDIMGMKNFNLNLNPFHIDVSQINCTQIIEKSVSDITNEEDDESIGELAKSDAMLLLSHEWAIIFLTETKITEAQRVEEEKKYKEEVTKVAVK